MNLENKDVEGILKYADPVIAAILNKAISGKDISARAVSYTHLTLPTICSV